jgi:lipopolysaccharide biosynthesis regulator YciM
MPEAGLLSLLLLPVAAATGWYLARRSARAAGREAAVNADYLRGLGHLVNEDADKAIQVFTRLLEVDHDTVEIHLALGNLFRRQGEVDRALRIHQNLVARPNLGEQHRNQARFELARDYLRAGMLDRAEDLFQELAGQAAFREQALSGLVGIYEQQRDWPQAIAVTRQLEAVRGHSLRPVIAQYLCELADEARRRRDLPAARRHLQQAYGEYHECVRASLMQGEIEEQAGNFEEAARLYRRVIEQDIEFAGEVIEPLARCYERLGRPQTLRAFLDELVERYDGPAPRIAMARQLAREGRGDEALAYLARALQVHPSWIGLDQLLQLAPPAPAPLQPPLEGLRAALRRVTEASPRYQCGHCGFHARTLYWLCPGCRQWNSVTPLKDVVPKIV